MCHVFVVFWLKTGKTIHLFSLGVPVMTREWPLFRFKCKIRFSFYGPPAQLLMYLCLHLLLDQLALHSTEFLWREKYLNIITFSFICFAALGKSNQILKYSYQ